MAIPPGSLIASYDFSDPSCWPGSGNTVFDLTIENNDLTLSNPSGGAVTFGGTGQSQYAGFNGDTTYLYRSQFSSSGSTFGGDNFTLSVWHNYNNSQSDRATFIMGGNGSAGDGPQLQVNGSDANKVTAAFGVDIFEGGQLVGIANTSDTWHMSTVTGDGTLLKLYQDGALIGSTSQAGTWDGRGFIIGRGLGSSYQPSPVGPGLRYAGYIGIAEVYGTALGSTDISDLYSLQQPRFYPPTPIVSYDFSDPACYPGSGTSIINLVNPATFTGTLSGVGFSASTDSFVFDATGDNIVTDDINLSDNFTYIILFNRGVPITPFESYYQQTLFSTPYRGSWASVPYYGIFLAYDFNTTDYNFRTNNGSTYVLNSFNVSNNVGDWTVASLTFSSGTATLYIDGVSASVITGIASPIPLTEAVQTCIGNNASFFTPEQDQFTGQIAVFEAYDSVLSGAAISSISTNLLNRYAPPPPPYEGTVGGRQLSQGFNG